MSANLYRQVTVLPCGTDPAHNSFAAKCAALMGTWRSGEWLR